MNQTTTETYVGWKEIARILGVSVRTARRWARKKSLPVYRLQGQVRLDRDDLKNWLKSNRETWVNIGHSRPN